ncbi:MAG: AraC family transcriptional regulator [Bradyrhizobiaceae bacterium]|nr:MAG: AraC family transcriptional regulator [Bradyrhizobiaceae bacterium]
MNFSHLPRLAAVLSVMLTCSGAWAQAPAPAPSKDTPPPAAGAAPAAKSETPPSNADKSTADTKPADAKPADTKPAETPAAPKAAETPAPSPVTPPAAQTAPPAEQKPQTADAFGEEATLTARKVVAIKGKGDWDSAFDTITGSLKTLATLLDKQNIKPAGPFLIVYTSTDDNGFTFQAQIPVDQDPKNLPKDISIANSPEGKTLKFVHHGSYDNMDNTYEAITNYLDEKKLEAKDTFIEEYVTDPLKTSEDKLVVNVFVPLK